MFASQRAEVAKDRVAEFHEAALHLLPEMIQGFVDV
jgi:hypothetical protein